MQKQIVNEFSQHLDALIADGKITAEEKDAILEFFCKNWDTFKILLDAIKKDAKVWAQIGIDIFEAMGNVIHEKFCPEAE